VSAGQTLVSINNSDLKAKKAQADATILQATAVQQCQERLRSFCDFIQATKCLPKKLDDMTARYEMTKAGLEAKQMRNEVLAQFISTIGSIFWVVTNTYVKGDMASVCLVSIEGAS
jgi:multidrug resistance efflux pump